MSTFDLDTPIINFGNKDNVDHWTIRHAIEGLQIFGGIGSGKTSGSGRMVALKFLQAGFGGLVLTVKPDERKLWEDYCQIAGRVNDLVIVEPGGKNFFNFLDYESRNSGSSLTENILHVLKTVLNASQQKDKGMHSEAFWENALDMLIFNTIDLCKLAYGTVSIQEMYEVVQSVPPDKKSMTDEAYHERPFFKALDSAREHVSKLLDDWEATLDDNTKEAMLEDDSYGDLAVLAVPEFRLLTYVEDFFIERFVTLNSKTKSIIEFSFSGFLYRFLRDPVFNLFCNTPSTIEPEDCFRGKIILIDLPVKIYDKVGRDAQIMFKYIWQRAVEKRQIDNDTRPLFLFSDEAQHFLHDHDAEYQATARSSRICTVYISQNLPNYFAGMGGGDYADNRVKSFLGTLNTKIFHSNADAQTNNYASDLIGDARFPEKSKGKQLNANEGFSISENESRKLERVLRPEAFISLKTGGPLNQHIVEGVMHRLGKPFPTGSNHVLMKFSQHHK